MKLSRGFSGKEKFLLAVFVLIIIGAAYFYLVDQPVRSRIANAQARQEELQTELTISSAKVGKLKKMKEELEQAQTSGKMSSTYMPSYNNVKHEITFLNDILSATKDYTVSFANVSRSGDQIRRSVALSYTTTTYEDARAIIAAICESENRVLITNIRMDSKEKDLMLLPETKTTTTANGAVTTTTIENNISTSMTIIFYETMVEGEEDTGLPEEKK